MAADEQTRHVLRQALLPHIGEEATVALIDALPGAEVATKQDLAGLEARLDARFESIDARFESIDARFLSIDARFLSLEGQFQGQLESMNGRFEGRFESLDGRLVSLEERMDGRINELRAELLAAFRGELVSAVVGQTRMMILALVGTIVALGGLALTLARFS